MTPGNYDVVVIGGGQSGLAMGYYLRRTGLSYVILDNQSEPGGAWQHHWQSLRLFSPAQWSSLPGMIMAGGSDYYPSRDVTLAYLQSYEEKYQLPIHRPVAVYTVSKQQGHFVLSTSNGTYQAGAVVSATGSFANPRMPVLPGMESFQGQIIHSSKYQSADPWRGLRVAVVGEGNSGAQILAEVSQVADTLWITQKEPRFLPDHVDGRFLFDAATQMYEAQKMGKHYQPPSLGDIVMVESVKEAHQRNVFDRSLRPFQSFSHDALVWSDGHEERVDAVIFCTGFRPSLNHLEPLNASGTIETAGTRATQVDGLWLVGYGHWTGFASATLIGVGRFARATAAEIQQYLVGKMKVHEAH